MFVRYLRERKLEHAQRGLLNFTSVCNALQTMVTFADGPTIPMPDFSGHSSSAGDMKFHLQNLLDSKEKQLQQAGTLGQRVLAQQMELEERIRQIQEVIEEGRGEEEEQRL